METLLRENLIYSSNLSVYTLFVIKGTVPNSCLIASYKKNHRSVLYSLLSDLNTFTELCTLTLLK